MPEDPKTIATIPVVNDDAPDAAQALIEAMDGAGFKVLTPDETSEFLSGIPSLEELESNRVANAVQNDRILLKEGDPATTIILDTLWAEAKEQTLETLPEFLKKISTQYQHDYGTVCHGVAMAAVAAAWAFDKGPSGGITGFQAGAVMWQFIRQWNGMKGPCKIVKYEDMLYPQNQDRFCSKTLDRSTWQYLQEQAAARIAEAPTAHPRVMGHWKAIVFGVVPFGYTVED